MARPQRIEYAGAVYHGTARGNERRAIFLDDADRQRLLCVLGESVERFAVRLYLFCLMSNHIHRAVETGALLRRRRNSVDCAIAARMLCDYGGLTQRQVAEVLGIGTGSPISRQLRKLTGELQSNRTLQKQVGAITAELRGYTPNANDYRKG